jgi:hypothetical protein
MLIDLLLCVLLVLNSVALVTGYCAYSYRRSFWLWFGLAWVLPLVSFYLLVVLLYRKELQPGEQLVAQANEILAEAEAAETARLRALLASNSELY